MIFQPNLIVNVVEPTSDRARYENPLPCATHYIGRFKYPLTTPGNSSVFTAHYSRYGEPFSGPVKKLTLNQLGSCETPNLTPYANTCEIVEFNGYINTASTVFEVVGQLPKVTKVDIFLGSAQQSLYANERPKYFAKTPMCRNVKQLKIVMDLEYFYSFQHADSSQCRNAVSGVQQSLVSLIESLLKHAEVSFPNLQNLIVDLPENDILCKAVQSLIKACHGLRKRTQTTLKNVMPREKAIEMYSTSGNKENSHDPPSWYPNGLPVGNSQVMQMAHSNLSVPHQPNPNNIFSDQGSTSPSSDEYSNVLPTSQEMQRINHRPPPGFAPLPPVEVPVKFIQSNAGISGFQESEVGQRVNNWLKNLER